MFWIVVTTGSTLLISYWAYRKFYCHKFFKRLGLSGPKPHWLFGNLSELYFTNGVIPRHLVIHSWSQQFGPYFGYYEGGLPVIVISSPEAVEQICVKQFYNFQGHRAHFVQPDPTSCLDEESPIFGMNVFFAWGADWKRLRTLVNPAFSTGKLKSYMPLISKSQRSLMAALAGRAYNGEEFNIHDLFQRLTLDLIGGIAFGLDLDSLNEKAGRSNPILCRIRRMINHITNEPPFFLVARILSELAPLAQRTCKFLAEQTGGGGMDDLINLQSVVFSVIRQRLADPKSRRSDILQSLIDCSKLTNGANGSSEKPETLLSLGEVIAQATVLFVAGAETTSTSLAYTSYLLSTHQDVQDRLYREISSAFQSETDITYDNVMSLPYLDWVCQETLRLYPVAVHAVNRFVMEDSQICGVGIPETVGLVLIDVYSLHRNPEYWGSVDPSVFHPERFSPEYKEAYPRPESAYLPFGYGPRLCVGMRLAMLEMKLTLINVLMSFKIVERWGGYPDGLPITTDLGMFPFDGVYVKLIPRA